MRSADSAGFPGSTLIVALDVGYRLVERVEVGRCGVVAFDHWDATASVFELSADVADVRPYVSGRLFERELPCLFAGLEALGCALPEAEIGVVIVDGNVRLDQRGTPGLGMYLFQHLGGGVAVVGVAKSPFRGLDAVRVFRGESRKPLHVTAAGMPEAEAARLVESMAGDHRIPTLLQRADQLSR